MKKEKISYAVKGDKVNVKKCPKCRSRLILMLDKDQTEVLRCDSCSFKVKKNKKDADT